MTAAALREWTIGQVEEAFIACHELWRRTPGEGRWPFAGDGPWNLMQAERGDVAGDWSKSTETIETRSGKRIEIGLDVVESRSPRTSLSTAEVGERDRVTAWLEQLPDPMSRAIVHQATLAMWRGESRPPWKVIKRALGWPKGLDALNFAYRRALATIACRMNGWPQRRARAMAETWRRYERWQGDPDALAVNSAEPPILKSGASDQKS